MATVSPDPRLPQSRTSPSPTSATPAITRTSPSTAAELQSSFAPTRRSLTSAIGDQNLQAFDTRCRHSLQQCSPAKFPKSDFLAGDGNQMSRRLAMAAALDKLGCVIEKPVAVTHRLNFPLLCPHLRGKKLWPA